MISISHNAKDINRCIHEINRQCFLHCGKAFLFPYDGIYDEYSGPTSDEISWSVHEKLDRIYPLGGLGKLGRLGQRSTIINEMEDFRRKINQITGLQCENIANNRAERNVDFVVTLRIFVTEAYSKSIYLNRLKEQLQQGTIVDNSNNNDALLTKATEFRMLINQFNHVQISKLAEISARTFGQTFVIVKKDSIDICKGYINAIERTVKFSDLGLGYLEEDYQLYAVAIELANEISTLNHYPKISDEKEYFVQIRRSENNYSISLADKSAFGRIKGWGQD